MSIWYILWSFGTFSSVLVCCTKKYGNPEVEVKVLTVNQVTKVVVKNATFDEWLLESFLHTGISESV
jgi:hypothetical protein